MNKMLTAGLTGCMLALTACGASPVVGEWGNEDNDEVYEDVLTVTEEGGERVETMVGYTEDGYYVELEIEQSIDWQETDDGFEAEVECDGASFRVDGELWASGCSDVAELMGYGSLDLGEVECQLNGDEDELECETESGDEVVYERSGE